jgi:hypothetical protein
LDLRWKQRYHAYCEYWESIELIGTDAKNKLQIRAETFARHPPPRSGLVQLLSELPALPAGYPETHKRTRAKFAAISFNKQRIVNLFS